ncbi:N-glycosidase [Lachnellula arida]|uniref:N-glycosidase n=1 Tax=Lachnellula arida TaxID=1316785 RepID=A0A8T9BMA7_9HELO|nr:N-glycosidase [Lachnellula arida]
MAHWEPPNHHGQQGQDLGSAAPTDAPALVPVASPVRESLVNNSHSEVVEPNTSESDHSKAPLASPQQEPKSSPALIGHGEQELVSKGDIVPPVDNAVDPIEFPLRTPQMANDKGKAPAGSTCFSKGIFSNFLQMTFKDTVGNEWKSGEQYFQMGKCVHFKDEDSIQKMLKADTPKKAKDIGNKVKGFEQQSWDLVKRQYMADTLYHKFRGEPGMVKELLATGSSLIIETRDDVVWGSGHNKADTLKLKISEWKGSNLLGEELMLLRDYFLSKGDEFTQLPEEGDIREAGQLADEPMIFRDKCWHVLDFDVSKWDVIANDDECAEDFRAKNVRISGALALYESIKVQTCDGDEGEDEGAELTPELVYSAIDRQWRQLNPRKKKFPAVFGQDEMALALSDLSNKATKWMLVVVSRNRQDPEAFEAIRRGPGSDQEGENVFVRYFRKTRDGPERWEGMRLKVTVQQEGDVIDPTGGFDWDLDVDGSYDGKGGEDD